MDWRIVLLPTLCMLGFSEETPFKFYMGDDDYKLYDLSQHTSPSLSKCFEMDEDGQSCHKKTTRCAGDQCSKVAFPTCQFMWVMDILGSTYLIIINHLCFYLTDVRSSDTKVIVANLTPSARMLIHRGYWMPSAFAPMSGTVQRRSKKYHSLCNKTKCSLSTDWEGSRDFVHLSGS